MKKVVCRQRISWFNDSIKCAIQARRKAERKWRADDDAEVAVQAMRDRVTDLRNWMINERLLMNGDKTEFLLLGARQQLAKVDIRNIRVGSSEVSPQPVVKNLGAWLDSTVTMSTHISKLCGAAFYHLHNISRIRKFLSLVVTKTLVHTFVTSHVDYCNSLLYGISASQLNKVQHILKAASRLVYRAPRCCHISPLMRDLHCLPIRQRIHFKVLLFTFKAIHGIAPLYIQDLVLMKSQGACSLRSTRGIFLAAPSVRMEGTLGNRSFSLPHEIRAITIVDGFKRRLKTYLFKVVYG